MKTALQLIREEENTIPRNCDKPVWAQTNYTRYYNHVVPLKSGECRIDTYAVKTRNKRTGELAIKKVAKYRTDRKRYHVRDILYHNCMHYYSVNWCNEPFGRKHQAVWEDVDASIGKWGYCDYTFGKTINLHARYLNGFEGTRYEHCGYFANSSRWSMHFLDFAECYNINHGVEFLAKNGFWNFITPTFVTRLSKDRELFRFFRQHFAEMQFHGCTGNLYTPYNIADFNLAYRLNTSLREAKIEREALRGFRGFPKDFPKREVAKWCAKHGISADEYREYADNARRCGEDITAFGVTMPRDFRAANEAYEARINAERIRRQAKADRQYAEERRAFNSAIASVAEDFKKLEKLSNGALTVVLPTSVKQLVAEGNAMHNCIGRMGYDKKIAEKQSLIVMVYRDGKPFVDIEIDRGTWTVRQCYAKHNKRPEEEFVKFASLVCRRAKAIYKQAA